MTEQLYRDFYYEDIQVGDEASHGDYQTTKEELIAFAKQWDPMIFHTDEDVAKTTPHGGLIAPGTYLLAIRIKLLHQGGVNRKILASAGFENVRFLKPSYVGEKLTLKIKLLEKRVSKSKPNYGLAKYNMELVNELGAAVLSMIDTVMIERNPSRRDDG